MADTFNAYRAAFGREPDNEHQLIQWSKKESGVKTLTFSEAKKVFAECKGKGAAEPEKKAVNAAPAKKKAAEPAKPVEKKPAVPPPAPSGGGPPPAPSGGGPPPAPSGGGPPPAPAGAGGDEQKEESGKSGLFAQLNAGVGITGGLKKVTADQKNKNQPKRSGKVPASSGAGAKPKAAAKSAAPVKKKDPIFQLKGMRYFCENHTEGLQKFDDATAKHEIFIANCSNSAYLIPNKVKSVMIDSCKKVQVEVNSIVSTLELINCQSVTVYCKGQARSIMVDKCAQPKMILFQEALDAEPKIITSMVTDFNIEVPGETEDSDMIEQAVPYQFETSIDPKTKKMVTKPVEHSG